MNCLKSFATLSLLLCAPWALGGPPLWKELALPLSVHARSVPTQAPEGWQVASESIPCELVGVTVFDGLPQEQAALVPQAEQALPGGRGQLGWTLSPVSSAGSWISLTYSCKALVLSRPLPTSAQGFRVTYDSRARLGGLPRILKAEYQEPVDPVRQPAR